MYPMEHIWTIVMLEICKHTFYAYLSRFWKMMQFTGLIRKVFTTKILLSGKFSPFLTLVTAFKLCDSHAGFQRYKRRTWYFQWIEVSDDQINTITNVYFHSNLVSWQKLTKITLQIFEELLVWNVYIFHEIFVQVWEKDDKPITGNKGYKIWFHMQSL